MKTSDLRQLSLEELQQKLRTTREGLLESRLRKQSGQLERTHEIKQMRRDIARLQTLINDKTRKSEATISA
ncbi:MAG: 50S ribosomal protein L29 [Opitutales bacterium]|nr:50S ribosomal protein L29 [Opitutales bacterium]MCH8539888.1 50S ribosomal protein L29 [Opitutales bacterium]